MTVETDEGGGVVVRATEDDFRTRVATKCE